MDEIRDDIKNGSFKPLYLLFGEERYLCRKYEGELVKRLSNSEFDLFDGKADVNDVINAAESMSFFGRRVVVWRDSGLFYEGRKADSEAFAEYLKNPPDAEAAVIIFNERGKVDKRMAVYKAAAKVGRAAEMTRQGERDVVNWLTRLAKAGGVLLPSGSAAYMLRYCGADMDALESELNKLISFKPGGEITARDVEELCAQTVEAKVFAMTDALSRKDAGVALRVFNDMVRLKESPLMALTMLARQFRLMYECKTLAAEGFSNAAIAAKLGIRDFVARDCVSVAKRFADETLLNGLNDCLGADVSIKTGYIEDRLAVEMIIAKYAGKAGAPPRA